MAEQPTTQSVIELDAVSFVRGGATLLDDVSLTVRRAEQWALLGPNGAGKSTLLQICSASSFPSRGTARILGSQMGRVDLRELRRSIGLVEARHPAQSNLSVRDLVLTGVTGTHELVPHWEPDTAHLD